MPGCSCCARLSCTAAAPLQDGVWQHKYLSHMKNPVCVKSRSVVRPLTPWHACRSWRHKESKVRIAPTHRLSLVLPFLTSSQPFLTFDSPRRRPPHVSSSYDVTRWPAYIPLCSTDPFWFVVVHSFIGFTLIAFVSTAVGYQSRLIITIFSGLNDDA